jgi:iron-sulfur cluster insertion protein
MKITTSAQQEIRRNARFLKIIVELGGCSGFQYELSFTDDAENLLIVENLIVTDEVSYKIIENIELDFINEIGYHEFSIKNPLIKKGCGCGNSFSL